MVEFFSPNRLYNQEILGDIMLNLTIPTYPPIFVNTSMGRYIKFIVMEQGLNGFFQQRTPQEYIEGYYDPLIYQLSQTPVYNSGDQTNDPYMAINISPAYPPNNTVVLFTGTDDSTYTRRVARWLDLDYISMKKKDYDSITQTSDRYTEPWDGRVYVSI